jgi:hypothetical protein
MRVPFAGKVLLIGWDAADWKVITVKRGKFALSLM